MTPEGAQALEHGLTPGGWNVDGDEYGDEILSVLAVTYDGQLIRGRRVAEEIDNPHDARLIAAAPDMCATVAEMRWEYGVEVRHDEDSEWQHTGPWWDTIEKARAWRGRAVIRIGQPYTHDRIVRRLVGPVEVVK